MEGKVLTTTDITPEPGKGYYIGVNGDNKLFIFEGKRKGRPRREDNKPTEAPNVDGQ